ncbi:MAG: hypothetical protein GMKNLPBB_00387 [Myxococcota bacterium]|nr:hypothetical protein [Myxococcota bacterium]
MRNEIAHPGMELDVLAREHAELEAELSRFRGRKHLTDEESNHVRKLKKIKLQKKTLIASMKAG